MILEQRNNARQAIERMRTWTPEGFIAFLEYVIKFETNSERRIRVAEHQRIWINHIFEGIGLGKHILIKAPWEHGKTWIVAIGWPLWNIGLNPNLRGAVICSTDLNAVKRLATIKAYIQNDRNYHQVFPRVQAGPEWNKTSMTVRRDNIAKDYTLGASGVTSAGTGNRLDYLLADDICDIRDQQSDAVREMRDQTFRATWLSRLQGQMGWTPESGRVPAGYCLYIGTPWHNTDTTAMLALEPGWHPR